MGFFENNKYIKAAVQSFILLVAFLYLYYLNTLAINRKHIQDNWDHYKCDVSIMPLAGMYGKDSKQVFQECIKDYQKDAMPSILNDVYSSVGSYAKLANELSGNINDMRTMLGSARTSQYDLIGYLTNVFVNVMLFFKNLIVALKDTLNKFIGIMGALIHILSALFLSAKSLYAGPAGKLLKFAATAQIG